MKVAMEEDFKGFDPSRSQPSRTTPGHTPDSTAGQHQDTPRTYSFAAIAAEVGKDESTVRRRWWAEKLEPTLQYCPEPLRVVVRQTRSGSPVYELTEFSRQVILNYSNAATVGPDTAERYLSGLKARYPEPEVLTPELVQDSEPDITPDTVPDKGGALALPKPQSTSSLATSNDAIEVLIEDLEADRETGMQLTSNFAEMLFTNPQALEQAAELMGKQAGQRIVNAYQRGLNEVVKEGFQQQIDVTQGKPES